MRNLILLIVMIIPLGAIAFAQTSDKNTETFVDWQAVGTDIEFQQFRLIDPVPVNIFVARMDRDNPNLTIESSIAQGRLSGGLETVSGMADRYNQALNNWNLDFTIPLSPTWGSRNNVIVAINGFYYGGGIEPPGVPWSGQIHSGWYAKRYTDFESISGFVWKMDRSAFIGECISHEESKQLFYIANGEDQFIYNIDGLNIPRGDNELILYTSQYDSDTNTDSNDESIEILIEMKTPTFVSIASDMPKGIVRAIRDGKGSTPIPFDHVVISAHGSAAVDLKSKFAESSIGIGNTVAIAQRVKDCVNPTLDRWLYAYAGVGGQFYFLRDGIIYDYSDNGQANVRDPRTAIAFNDDYVFFIVADGRDPGVSEGMKVAEMAEFAKNILGATEGVMQDGGGSSTMVINGNLVNNTFCNNVFCTDKVFLPLVSNTSDLPANSSSEPFTEWITEANTLERLVANGMMMVEVQTVERSTTPFDPDDPVTTIGNVNLYLGPGTNYAVFDTISGDGTIQASLNQLGGVLAKDSYWWKVKIGSKEGWVPEALITQLIKNRSSNEFKPR